MSVIRLPLTMRLLTLLVVALLWSTPASAQQITIGGCEVVYSTWSLLTDPGDPTKIIGIAYRRDEGLPVEARCPGLQVFAQEIDYWEPDDRLDLRGQVVFQQGGTRIAAVAGQFHRRTQTARFETASGTLLLTDRQVDRSLFGAMEPEASFTADLIEKTGPRTYRLTNATFSTCVQPSRRWQIGASTITFTVDRYAIMHNARLEVKDVSLLYVPVFYFPIREDNRATGFLMPTYGSSTFRGFTLSNAFFWAINRSADATIYHDWFTRSGQGIGADFRYVGHRGSAGNVRFYGINEKALFADDGVTQVTPAKRSYEFRGNLIQALPANLRLQGRADFFTDITTQQLYQTDLSAFTQRSSYFGMDVSGAWGRLRGSAQADRNDVYFGTSATSYRTLPRVNLSVSEAPIGRTKVYLGGSLDAVGLVRIPDVDTPDTRDEMFRTDGRVSMRAPVSFGSALTLTGMVSARRTDWNASRDPDTGARIEAPISRQLFEAQVRAVGPVFSRIYNTAGNAWLERVKHVVEPSVTVMRRSAFDRFDEVIPLDPAVDRVVGGVTQVSYGISNRILARVRQGGDAPSVVQELASLDITQSYYSDQTAAIYDGLSSTSFGAQNTQLPPPSNFSPVRVSLNLRPTPTANGQFGLEYDTRFGAVRSYRASASVTQPYVDFSGSWSKQQVIPGLQGYDDPRYANHYLSFSSRVKTPGGGGSLTYSTAVDILNSRFAQHRFGAFYNAQCCGVAMDYVVVDLSHYGLRNDKRFSLSFSLAGIGSFVNPLGVFGNNGRQ
jgi:LPS-assembly protein